MNLNLDRLLSPETREKLRFKWTVWRDPSSLFRTDAEGYGFRPIEYRFWSDRVHVRLSRFGYVEGFRWMSRDAFLASGKLYEPHKPEVSVP